MKLDFTENVQVDEVSRRLDSGDAINSHFLLQIFKEII